jgi:hypothetical protein
MENKITKSAPKKALRKTDVRRSVLLKLSIEDAETLEGLIDGAVGSADDKEFAKFGNRLLKKLKTSIDKHYA